ncbi:MAG: nucleotidyltransferase family protein, partial [Rickettsiales bacterium]|nr:nucleotidyltransferase family protein [Rickettsiales bacterium]
RAWYENNLLFHRVMPVVAALEAAGIACMVMKGMPIALCFHASHATRPMADLDLLVRSEQAADARRVLAGLGFAATTKHPAHEQPDLHAQDFRNAEGTEIDLHWYALREVPGSAIEDWFWASALPFTYEGVTCVRPAATPLLAHTLLHGLRSNLEPSIRWVSDAAALMGQQQEPLDWQGLVDFAAKHRLSHRMALGLSYLAEEFQQPVPAWVVPALRKAGVSLAERAENIIYLGPAQRMYSPYLYPLVDYWRYRRVLGMGAFWRGYPAYPTRRWRVRHPVMLPVVAVSTLLRRAL